MNINNNKQNKDRNILINTVQLNTRYPFVNVLTKDITEDALGKFRKSSTKARISLAKRHSAARPLSTVRAAIDRYLLPAGRSAANPQQRQAAGE